MDNCNKTETFPSANRPNETIYLDKTCVLNFIPVRITQRTIVNDARRISNPNNLIYRRSDPLPVNSMYRSCHFVPSIILANVMSLSPKIDEIRLYVQDHVPDIMCVTETCIWLKDTVENSVINIRNYTLVRKDRIYAQHGGVGLYIKDTLPFTVLREYERDTSIEVLWCKLCPRRLPRGFSYIIVGVVYHPPTADDQQMINYLINTLSEIESSIPNAAIILTGDCNRLNIAQVATQFHLKQLVKFQTRAERTLDLILTNLNKFYQAPTKDPPFGLSDHNTVCITPRVTVRDMTPSSSQALGRFLSNINWSVLENVEDVNEKYAFFNDIILMGMDTIMPAKTINLRINDVPWMTGHLKHLIKCRQKALKDNCPTQFKLYRNQVNRERKYAKAKYYDAKVKDLKNTEPKKWWSECKKLCGMSKPIINIVAKLLDESQAIEDKINLANEINLAFLEPQKNYLKLSSTCKINTLSHQIPSVTTEMITKQLRSISSHKAAGPDNILSWVLKDFADILALSVSMLINESFKKEQLPLIWKCANIAPLPKSSTVNDINTDLRPISLTPTISKIAEEYVVENHVKPAVLKHIRPDQYGCIPQSSTTHALIDLIHQWSKATDGTSSDVRVFVMDYRKAFDLIDHSLFITKLKG